MPEPAHEMAQNAASRTLARELVRTALENPGANIVDSPEALARIDRLLLSIDLHRGSTQSTQVKQPRI